MNQMQVRSVVADQELHTPHSTDVDYYEGASDVLDAAGKKIGEGYLEMTGYGKPVGF
jgi:predicted secreted hydrolase